MAKLKVKSGDSLVSISNKNKIPLEDLKVANPGVSTLKPGQAIKVPNKIEKLLGGGMNSSAVNVPNIIPNFAEPFVPKNTPQPGVINNPLIGTPSVMPRVNSDARPNYGTYTDPRLQAGRGTNANFGSPDPRLSAGRSQNANYGGQQPYLGSSGYLNPAYQTPQNTQPTNVPTASNPRPVNGATGDPRLLAGRGANANFTTGQVPLSPDERNGKNTVPARPATPFTGDPLDPNTDVWRAYWNATAALGYDPNAPTPAPYVMTREEIWQMKAASRRKKLAGMSSDELGGGGGGGSYAPYQYSETNQSPIAEPLVRSITWGI